ncbi:MAG TPA: acetyl-CoA C-acetyltransferase [Thermodesulfobacteriota bacterium]|nr:acetyl-CoA C-acetyltransferase [Thermodesulfobacteriota bacterium]
MSKVVICEPLRTAIGTFGGTIKDIPAPELGAVVVKEILKRSKIDPKDVDDVIMGNVLQAAQGMGPARQVAIKAGLDVGVPAITINRLCASGCQAIVSAAQEIKSGDAEIVIAGGIENMDQAPFYLKKARYGYRMGMPKEDLFDGMVSDGLWDVFNDYHMGVTAENVAEKYKISKEEQDEFAYKSQMKAKEAMESNRFQDEIVPIPIPQRKGDPVMFKKDEHPRGDTTLETLSKLRPAFKKDGTVTAGNASGINDGAAAMIVTTEEKAKELGLKIWGTVRSYGLQGVDPSIMGMGPVGAMQKALEKAGLTIDDIDLVELNEAFAAQSLGVLREFPIPDDKLNVNGGAIALGHPIGASGAALTVKILHELERRNASLGLVSLCVGGGMGIAMVVERE